MEMADRIAPNSLLLWAIRSLWKSEQTSSATISSPHSLVVLKHSPLTLIKTYYNKIRGRAAITNPPRVSVELFNSVFCAVVDDCAPPPSGCAQKTLTNTQNVVWRRAGGGAEIAIARTHCTHYPKTSHLIVMYAAKPKYFLCKKCDKQKRKFGGETWVYCRFHSTVLSNHFAFFKCG